jgi:hypothetical protein
VQIKRSLAAAIVLLLVGQTSSYATENEGDLLLVVKSSGWSEEEARAFLDLSAVVGEIASKYAAETDNLVGSRLPDHPAGSAAIYVKGTATEDLKAAVAASHLPIQIVDDQPFSSDELEARRDRAHRAVEGLGFSWVYSEFDITSRGRIAVSVAPQDGMSNDSSEVLASIPADLRADVAISFVEPTGTRVDGGGWGGMWVTLVGENTCTSGWSVKDLDSGLSGVTTAGHCVFNGIRHPGPGIHIFNFQNGHEGVWGDVAFGSTVFPEPAQFYADSSDIRPVNNVELAAGLSLNEWVCGYGRKSDNRFCYQITNTSAECPGGVLRLVRVSGNHLVTGDSGGGWSYNNRAYGSHVGNCGTNFDHFSVADYFPQAIGVEVKTQ